MQPDETLFMADSLRGALEAQRLTAMKAIDTWDPDQLLATAEADVVEHLLAKYAVACPELDRQRIEQLPISEDVQSVQGWNGRTYERRATKITISVPFDGEEDVFKYRASTRSFNPPRGSVQPGELRLTWIGEGGDPEGVRQHFDGELDTIDKHLSWAKTDIKEHNDSLESEIPSAVARRRAKLLADRKLESGLGFPVRQRSDASKYSVPTARRKIATVKRPTASGPFQPEPVLPTKQYEEALGVLRNARNALERSPSMTSSLSEEKIRDLLLTFLNAQFEGTAAGEVFNGAGKTDILIRAGDRNVFIAECKIWKGPKTIQDALTQLLGYLVWRDTKAALLLFIRRGEPTTIIDKTLAEIKGHPNFKRTTGEGEPGERYDFVLHANDDPNQEIQLAFMPFALRDK